MPCSRPDDAQWRWSAGGEAGRRSGIGGRRTLRNAPEDKILRLPLRDSIARRLIDDWLEQDRCHAQPIPYSCCCWDLPGWDLPGRPGRKRVSMGTCAIPRPPPENLIAVCTGNSLHLHKDAVQALRVMINAARADGADLRALSCLRSIRKQRYLFCRYVCDPRGQICSKGCDGCKESEKARDTGLRPTRPQRACRRFR